MALRLLSAFLVLASGSSALAFNEHGCGVQAHIMAVAIVKASVGSAESKYKVTPLTTSSPTEFEKVITYSATGGKDSMSLVSVTPMASTSTKRSLWVASGVTTWRSLSGIVRTPRPFICSK